MNISFLQQVAEDLDDYLDGHFEQLTIVVPNKRTRLFLDPLFAAYAQPGKPLWAPRYATITELFASLSDLQPADELLSVALLHQAYTKALHSNESFDHFYAWGQTLLADFDDMDNNLVDTERLFNNLKDLNELTTTDYLSAKQVESVNRFFRQFHEGHLSQMKERFRLLCQQLQPIYQQLRGDLKKRGLAYPGMLKREVAEQLAKETPTQTTLTRPTENKQVYAFVGFHLRSPSEKALFDYLNATCLTYDFEDKPDNLYTPKGEITIVQASSDNAQARFAGPWIEQRSNNLPATPTAALDAHTAIVLCDEQLLQPLLHSLPPQLAATYNVSMGYPLNQTPLFSFLHALIDLQLHGFAQGKAMRWQQVTTLLQHPYTTLLFPDDSPDSPANTLAKLRKDRNFLPTIEDIPQNLKPLFRKQKNAVDLIHHLQELIDLPSDAEENDPLLGEALFATQALLTRFATLLQDSALQRLFANKEESKDTAANVHAAATFLITLLRRTRIPFSGEPADGIQILGLLETRNLDFDNLLIIGANEGNLPRRIISHSFIPYPLREAYGMSTHKQVNDLYKYYFYRLLARAKHTTLLYNATPQSRQGGEPSRFILQLLINHKTTLHTLQSPMKPMGDTPLSINKNKDVLQRLKARYALSLPKKDTNKPPILSPSAINSFINCPLQFYLHYVAEIRMPQSMEEEVPANTFGTIFHEAMLHIYTQIFTLGTTLQKEDLEALSKDEDKLKEVVIQAFKEEIRAPHGRYTSEQVINIAMLSSYVQRQLREDANLCPLIIHAAESGQPNKEGNPQGDGQQMETCRRYVKALDDDILLGGIIDRRDTITLENGQRVMRIVDYKTSATPHEARKVEDFFNPNAQRRPYHFLQACYYAEIYATNHPDQPVAPAIAYVKKEGDPVLHVGKEPIKDYNRWEGRDRFNELLDETLDRLFSPKERFQPTTNTNTCQHCDFAIFCGQPNAGR